MIARIRVHLANARLTQSARAALDVSGRFLLAVSAQGHILWATPQAQKLLAEHSAKEPFDFTPDDTDAIKADVKKLIGKDLATAYKIVAKGQRQDAVGKAKAKASEKFGKSEANPNGIGSDKLGGVFKELEADVVRRNILDTGIRIDGRKVDQVRQIVGEVGVLPRAHGSALFTRDVVRQPLLRVTLQDAAEKLP
eukprot:gene473-663_t